MKIKPQCSNLNFQKKLVAKCKVLKNGVQNDAKIYLLERKLSDRYELKKLSLDKNWKNNHYLDAFTTCYTNPIEKSRAFLMKDDKGNTLALGSLLQNYKNKNTLFLLESAPSFATTTKERKYRYIGETMLAFLVGLSKREHKNLYISCVADRSATKDFYFKQCGFKELSDERAIMKKKKAGKFIKANENHTGSAIEFMI